MENKKTIIKMTLSKSKVAEYAQELEAVSNLLGRMAAYLRPENTETLKPADRQEEMAEEGKAPENLLLWQGGGGTLARGEVYAIVGKPKSGALTLAKVFAACITSHDTKFGGFVGTGNCASLFLTDRGEAEAERAKRDLDDWAYEWGDRYGGEARAYSVRGKRNKEEYIKGTVRQEQGEILVVIDGADELCDYASEIDCASFWKRLREFAAETKSAVLVTVPDYGGKLDALPRTALRYCAETFQISEEGGVFHVSTLADGAPLEVFSFTREGKRGIPTIKEIKAATRPQTD